MILLNKIFSRRIVFAFFTISSTFMQCEIINKEETIPSYLYVDAFTLNTNLSTEGFASSKIVDAWIYVDEEAVGVFQLPALVPVLKSGEVELLILAGIKENGISGTGVDYPFYDSYQATININPAEIDTIHPTTSYYPGLNFILIERFELGNDFTTSENSDTSFIVTEDPTKVFEGLRSATATLEGDNYFFRSASFPDTTFPSIGNPVYLELDYTCTGEFEVWLSGSGVFGTSYAYVITITPKETWNKIYVSLLTATQFLQADSYQLEFRATRPTDVSSVSFSIDNIKIISN